MSYRTPEQVEQLYVDSLGVEFGTVFHRLVDECTWLHWKWGEYVTLFGSEPERIDLLNESASAFFRMAQDTVWDDVLLHIARLTDPARSAGKDNLTLRRLPAFVAPELREEVERLLSECLDRCEFARDWRRRHLAHRDLSLAIDHGAEPLAHASRLVVGEAIDSIADLLNAVESHYLKSELAYDLGGTAGRHATQHWSHDA